MNQQPDKLFRDKLYGHGSPVSPDAWHKVASNIRKTSSRGLWLKVAATILTVITTGIFLHSVVTDKASTVVSETTRTYPEKRTTPQSGPDTTNTLRQPPIEAVDTGGTSSKTPSVAQSARPKLEKDEQVRPTEPRTNNRLPVVESRVAEPVALAQAESEAPAETVSPHTEPAPARKSVTIVFTSEEVNQKYLRRPVEAHATSEEKEASTLKNLLDKAIELKHNQDPLGELRQRKDQILAMNFNKDKQRTETD